ncbi:MAG: ABC transporter ATP-binding protein [Candidatus Binatia bacterium]
MDLTVQNLRKVFRAQAGEVQAVHGASFSVPNGVFFTLLGPSGSGKTTILRCIGGLEMPDSGEIRLGEKIYYSDKKRIVLMPEERGIAMVFQSYAIWPHMTVFNNVAFPLKYGLKRVPNAEIKSKVRRVLKLVQMDGLESRMATQLSGGQQQRVALARALVSEPDLLLLDEPLSNLDAKLREEMRIEIRRIQKSLGLTTIYVTHDQAEALSMSDQVALLRSGEIVQIGAPRELYERPSDVFASSFIGTSNKMTGTLERVANAGSLGVARIQGRDLICVIGEGCREKDEVVVSVRPEDIEVAVVNDPTADGWKGVVRQVVYFGDNMSCEIDSFGSVLRAKLHPSIRLEEGQQVLFSFRSERCVAFPAKMSND